MTEIQISDMAEQALAAFQAPAKLQKKYLEGEIEPSLQMKGEEKAIERLLVSCWTTQLNILRKEEIFFYG